MVSTKSTEMALFPGAPSLVVSDADGGSRYMSIRKAPARQDAAEELRDLPNGVQRRPVVDKMVRSIKRVHAAMQQAAPRRSAMKTPRNNTPSSYFASEDDEGLLEMVDESGELTGERYGIETRCDLMSRECKTVLVPRRGFMRAVFDFSILRPIMMLLWIPRLILLFAKGVIEYTKLGLQFCAVMLSIYSISQVVMALLHVMFRMNLGDMDGRYHYMMQIVAYAAQRMAWLPLYVFTYAAWIGGTAFGLEMGPPPSGL